MSSKTKTMRRAKVIAAVTSDLVTDNRVHKVSQTLTHMGFDVQLVGRKLKQSPAINERAYETKRFQLFFEKSFLFYASYNIRLFIHLLFNKFDIVLSNDLDTLPACYFASFLKGKKLFYDSHEYFTEVPELIDNPRVKRFWERIEAKMVPHVTKAYTVCASIANVYTEKYGIPFRVVRNLPYRMPQKVDQVTIDLPIDQPFVIYQGAINKGRGIEEIIEAMTLLPKISLVIAGGGDLLHESQKRVEELNLNERVHFTGRLQISELLYITSKALAGLSVEKDMGLNYRYALPNKLFDYMNAGIPVIVSALPEMKRVVETYKTGIVIKETSPHAIAAAIQDLTNSQEMVKVFKKNSLIAAQELCWENEEEILKKIFTKDLLI
jgi:glycosyltransferase involved in cell wall biosynthesis